MDSSYNFLMSHVDCSTSNYLVILQCSYSFFTGSCERNRDEVSVTCCESLPCAQYVQQGYVIGHVYIFIYVYMSLRNRSFGVDQSKNLRKESFLFALRHHECDTRLLVLGYSCFLLVLVCPLGLQGPWVHTRVQ